MAVGERCLLLGGRGAHFLLTVSHNDNPIIYFMCRDNIKKKLNNVLNQNVNMTTKQARFSTFVSIQE